MSETAIPPSTETAATAVAMRAVARVSAMPHHAFDDVFRSTQSLRVEQLSPSPSTGAAGAVV